MKASWRYLAGFAALAAAAVFAWTNQEAALTYVVAPISRISWLLTRTLMIVDQEIYWGALIFVVVTFGLRFLPTRWERTRVLPYNTDARPENRAQFWANLIRSAGGEGSRDERARLARALNELNDHLAGAAGEMGAPPVDPLPEKDIRGGRLRRAIAQLGVRLSGKNQAYENRVETSVRRTLEKLETLMERQNESDKPPAGDRR